MPMQSGYAVIIKGFVSVADRSDLDSHAKAPSRRCSRRRSWQRMDQLFELMTIENIDVRPRTRHAPEPKADNGVFDGERGPEGPTG